MTDTSAPSSSLTAIQRRSYVPLCCRQAVEKVMKAVIVTGPIGAKTGDRAPAAVKILARLRPVSAARVFSSLVKAHPFPAFVLDSPVPAGFAEYIFRGDNPIRDPE